MLPEDLLTTFQVIIILGKVKFEKHAFKGTFVDVFVASPGLFSNKIVTQFTSGILISKMRKLRHNQ